MDPIVYRKLQEIIIKLDDRMDMLQERRRQEEDYSVRIAGLVDRLSRLVTEMEEQKKIISLVNQIEVMDRMQNITRRSEALNERTHRLAKGAIGVAQVIEMLAKTALMFNKRSPEATEDKYIEPVVKREQTNLSDIVGPLNQLLQGFASEADKQHDRDQVKQEETTDSSPGENNSGPESS